jgi:protein-S-isoprenylcysteine O-methyltransferase Ste14
MELLVRPGLANAWILVLPIWILGFLISACNRRGMARAADMSWYTAADRAASFGAMAFMIAAMALSVFVPMAPGSVWFFAGLPLVAAGAGAHFAARLTYMKTDADRPATRGVYRLSRNPMYVSWSLVLLGAAISSRSLVLGAAWALMAGCTHLLILGEERYCKERYGAAYLDYMARVPRYFLFL